MPYTNNKKRIAYSNSDVLNKYLLEIENYDLVSPDEEIELSIRLKEGDAKAIERLINAHLRFVVIVAKQYTNDILSLEDMINEGNIGLIKAAYRSSDLRNFKRFFIWWISQSIKSAIAEQSKLIGPTKKSVGFRKWLDTTRSLEAIGSLV